MGQAQFLLHLPFESKLPSPRTDALVDFHLRVDQLINYVGDILLILDASQNTNFSDTKQVTPILPKDIFNRVPKVPVIEFDGQNWGKYRREIPKRLFYSAIVQLVSHFETFLAELLNDIYYSHIELLINDERQLTTKEIFELGSLQKIHQHLKQKAVSSIITKSYPNIVSAFQRNFYVGIHSKNSPVEQKEIHHLIEIRNVLIHNDGHASNLYFERMSIYDPPCQNMLKKSGGSVPIDFIWFLTSSEKILRVGDFIDAEIQKKWITTASPEWNKSNFDAYFLED